MSDFWIQTYTGVRFDLLVPETEMVDINDIAHAESMQCRFTGHPKFFYSVAEHSFNVSTLVENYCRRVGMGAADGAHAGLEALLHDAAEAYVGDMSRPMKMLLRASLREAPHGWELEHFKSSFYDRIELGVQRVVMKKFFGVPEFRNYPLIKKADMHMLAVEARQVLDGGPRHTWGNNNGDIAYDPEFAVPHIACMAPETARRMFVMRAAELQEVIEGRA